MKKFVFSFIFFIAVLYGCSDAGDSEETSVDAFFSGFDSSGCEIVVLNGHSHSFDGFIEYACDAEKMDYIQKYAQNLSSKHTNAKTDINENYGTWYSPPYGYAYASVDAEHSGSTGIDISNYKQDYSGKIIVRLEKIH